MMETVIRGGSAMRAFLLPTVALTITAAAAPLPEFPASAVWSRDISNTTTYPASSNSSTMITATGGWGNSNKFQIDQSMHVVHVKVGDPTPPMVTVVAGPYGYTYDPLDSTSQDCEPLAGLTFPLPPGGAIEGTADYTSCTNDSEDCHLFVVLDSTKKLYESYETKLVSGQLQSGCVVIWDLNKVYPPQGRGEQCTSADAAGFPMAPLLFNADEVYAAIQSGGDFGHAIRFILPNAKMASVPNPAFTCGTGGRQGLYVHPASHGGCPTGPSTAIPYGSRLRLHSNYNISGYSAAGQAVLRTMKKYGIVLSDGGNVALTAEDDMFTTHKWAEFGFDESNVYMEQMVVGVHMTDFDVVETGPQHLLTYSCDRSTVPDDFVFIDYLDY